MTVDFANWLGILSTVHHRQQTAGGCVSDNKH